jgi:hypothetical protein
MKSQTDIRIRNIAVIAPATGGKILIRNFFELEVLALSATKVQQPEGHS